MDTITIRDLEVFFCVGVPDDERAKPQRLLVSIEIEHDFTSAAASDDLGETIDYYAMSQRVLHFGEGTHWKLIETLAVDLAQMLIDEFRVRRVTVEVKKFIIPQAHFVSVRVARQK